MRSSIFHHCNDERNVLIVVIVLRDEFLPFKNIQVSSVRFRSINNVSVIVLNILCDY